MAALLLAGCSGGASDKGDDSEFQDVEVPDEVDASATTGGIRGIVVDEAIRPVDGATIKLSGPAENKEETTGAGGTFSIGGLDPGTYFIEASHPLYDKVQQTVEVKAGEKEPPIVRMQLTRVILQDPYSYTTKYDGFIVCSANAVLPLVGGVLSEECGEGVGVPGVGRVGGQDGNNVQYDFYVDGPLINTLVIEMAWEPTSEAGTALYTPVSLDWVCDPFCGGIELTSLEGTSPLRTEVNVTDGMVTDTDGGEHNLTVDTRISTFTWASPDNTPIGVTLNQDYQVFVSHFYLVPPPEGWSFVAGDPEPF